MAFGKGNLAYERYIHSSAWRGKADGRLNLDRLNALADYMVSVSGTGKFRGETCAI